MKNNDTTKIDFSHITKDLYNTTAKHWADTISDVRDRRQNLDLKMNSYTQVRMFYDDIEKLYTQSKQVTPEDFNTKVLPLFGMLNSKVGYAQGRDLVTKDFVTFVNTTVNQVNTPTDLETCKIFWEAFMGFYRQCRPTNSKKNTPSSSNSTTRNTSSSYKKGR